MKKEPSEWIHSWCDETQQTDLPRVLLVGDSITHGYQEQVRERLRGVCYVDYVSTSYAIDTKMYNELVKNFVADSGYALVHFNHGLHGKHISKRSYKSRVRKLLAKFSAPVVLATTTFVYHEGNKRVDGAWMKRVRERNEAMRELSEEKGYAIDDLFAVSIAIPKEKRYVDGTHYTAEGYKIFAETVAECIKNNLK